MYIFMNFNGFLYGFDAIKFNRIHRQHGFFLENTLHISIYALLIYTHPCELCAVIETDSEYFKQIFQMQHEY